MKKEYQRNNSFEVYSSLRDHTKKYFIVLIFLLFFILIMEYFFPNLQMSMKNCQRYGLCFKTRVILKWINGLTSRFATKQEKSVVEMHAVLVQEQTQCQKNAKEQKENHGWRTRLMLNNFDKKQYLQVKQMFLNNRQLDL